MPKNVEEKFELLSRRISKDKNSTNGILAPWDAQKCMVYKEKTQNYLDNGFKGGTFPERLIDLLGGMIWYIWLIIRCFSNSLLMKLYTKFIWFKHKDILIAFVIMISYFHDRNIDITPVLVENVMKLWLAQFLLLHLLGISSSLNFIIVFMTKKRLGISFKQKSKYKNIKKWLFMLEVQRRLKRTLKGFIVS